MYLFVTNVMKALKGSSTLTYMMINQAYFEIALNCYYDKNMVKASKQPNKKTPGEISVMKQ